MTQRKWPTWLLSESDFGCCGSGDFDVDSATPGLTTGGMSFFTIACAQLPNRKLPGRSHAGRSPRRTADLPPRGEPPSPRGKKCDGPEPRHWDESHWA